MGLFSIILAPTNPWTNIAVSRFAVALIVLAGLLLVWRPDTSGLYLLAPGILLCFSAAGANAWVLLIEIRR